MIDLLFDSGAFGAWRAGKPIDLDAYVAFIKLNSVSIKSYAALDVIPGVDGRMMNTPAEVEKSAKASYENLQRMKRAGLEPIPVFHQGERWAWLEKMRDDGEPYIGLSPYTHAAPQQIVAFLDGCFSVLTDPRGNPLVKTHGFGVTHQPYIVRYPWYSVDSSTWAVGAGFGKIIVPPTRAGEPDYIAEPETLFVTGEQRERPMREFQGMGKLHQELVLDYIKRAGCNIGQVRNSIHARMTVFAYYFRELERYMPARPFMRRRNLSGVTLPTKRHKPHDWPPSIYLASFLHVGKHNTVLNAVGVNTRLLSYFTERKATAEQIAAYVSEGILPERKKRRNVSRNSETYRVQRSLGLIDRLAEYEAMEDIT